MSTLALLLNFCLPAATVRISQSCTQIWFALLFVCSLNGPTYSVFEPHVIAFGNKWNTVLWSPGGTDEKPLVLKVRPLLVEACIKGVHDRPRTRQYRPLVRGPARFPGE
jgi:hypothetical protein